MQLQDNPAPVDNRKMDQLARGSLQVRSWRHFWGERTLVMGIVNVTPDSFSGDGVMDAAAVAHALSQRNNGADIIDLGAESTRPGHATISVEEELHRLLPVLKGLRQKSDCVISVDTTKAEVLIAAVGAGADILNSIWGLNDSLLKVVGQLSVPVVLMHNKEVAIYERDVVDEVVEYLKRQAERALAAGITCERIILDPGIGFGKTAEHNLLVLRSLDRLVSLGFPTLLGASRKSFIGKLTGKSVDARLHGTSAAVALAVAAGIDVVRVHDVAEMLDVVTVADAIIKGNRPPEWQSLS